MSAIFPSFSSYYFVDIVTTHVSRLYKLPKNEWTEYEAKAHIDKILKPYEHVLDTEWKDLKDDGIISEWIQNPNDGLENREIKKTILYLHGGGYYLRSKESHRDITGSLAKKANARVLAINYRLARQNQLPAALQNALAAYSYPLNPPKDAGFESLNPKNIVITVCHHTLGPWVDFTRSTSAALTAKIKEQNLGPKIWHDSFDRPEGRLQLYAPNEGLAIPYVSPISSEPTKYKGPSYNASKFEKSPFQTPANTLEIYENMPRVFQFMEHASTEKSYERMAKFIDRVTNSLNESLPPSSYNYINVKGEISPVL
ncbi:alpha/beta hydrolase protein [Rhizophagus clarus]|uniref:Alpha/beta hydrolase protein n=1 Tax=Rhizophagus clarus TaxID=94130 RepID=A0A8H3QFL1_9GLOM|nr:alpha/beta hydrolase protein [Rhizophagus clarus]